MPALLQEIDAAIELPSSPPVYEVYPLLSPSSAPTENTDLSSASTPGNVPSTVF